MPRPKRCRRVCFDPSYKVFKPQGVPMSDLTSVEMEVDELEALRLSDVERISQAEGASRMGISQPTFNRILSSARCKTARCVIDGKALKIAKNVPHTMDSRGRGDDR
jgi:predicted DNA-binding protein (UPF0251 family)